LSKPRMSRSVTSFVTNVCIPFRNQFRCSSQNRMLTYFVLTLDKSATGKDVPIKDKPTQF
jgi:hypothetical protein